jgi:hypothetical protein
MTTKNKTTKKKNIYIRRKEIEGEKTKQKNTTKK